MSEAHKTQLVINCRDIKKDAQAVPSVNIQGISRLSDIIIPALLYHPGYTFSCPSDTVGKSLIKIIVNQIDKITHTFSKSTIINGIKPLEVIQNIENVTIDAGWGNDTMKKYGLNPASNRYLMNIFETAGSFIDPATRPKPNNSASIFFRNSYNNPQTHSFSKVGLNVTLDIELASPAPPTQKTLLTFTIKPIESNNIFPESPHKFTLDRYGSLYEFKEKTWQQVNPPDERVTKINDIPIFKYIAGNKTKNNFINKNSGSEVSDISVNQEIALYTIFKEIGDTFQVLYLNYIINQLTSDVYKLENTTSLSVDMPLLARSITTNTPCIASNNSAGTIFFYEPFNYEEIARNKIIYAFQQAFLSNLNNIKNIEQFIEYYKPFFIESIQARSGLALKYKFLKFNKKKNNFFILTPEFKEILKQLIKIIENANQTLEDFYKESYKISVEQAQAFTSALTCAEIIIDNTVNTKIDLAIRQLFKNRCITSTLSSEGIDILEAFYKLYPDFNTTKKLIDRNYFSRLYSYFKTEYNGADFGERENEDFVDLKFTKNLPEDFPMKDDVIDSSDTLIQLINLFKKSGDITNSTNMEKLKNLLEKISKDGLSTQIIAESTKIAIQLYQFYTESLKTSLQQTEQSQVSNQLINLWNKRLELEKEKNKLTDIQKKFNKLNRKRKRDKQEKTERERLLQLLNDNQTEVSKIYAEIDELENKVVQFSEIPINFLQSLIQNSQFPKLGRRVINKNLKKLIDLLNLQKSNQLMLGLKEKFKISNFTLEIEERQYRGGQKRKTDEKPEADSPERLPKQRKLDEDEIDDKDEIDDDYLDSLFIYSILSPYLSNNWWLSDFLFDPNKVIFLRDAIQQINENSHYNFLDSIKKIFGLYSDTQIIEIIQLIKTEIVYKYFEFLNPDSSICRLFNDPEYFQLEFVEEIKQQLISKESAIITLEQSHQSIIDELNLLKSIIDDSKFELKVEKISSTPVVDPLRTPERTIQKHKKGKQKNRGTSRKLFTGISKKIRKVLPPSELAYSQEMEFGGGRRSKKHNIKTLKKHSKNQKYLNKTLKHRFKKPKSNKKTIKKPTKNKKPLKIKTTFKYKKYSKHKFNRKTLKNKLPA